MKNANSPLLSQQLAAREVFVQSELEMQRLFYCNPGNSFDIPKPHSPALISADECQKLKALCICCHLVVCSLVTLLFCYKLLSLLSLPTTTTVS